jgi:transposase
MDTALFPRATHRPVNLRSLFALPRGLAVTAVALEEDAVVVALESRTTRAICPLCQTTTRCSHSWYLRTRADLPCAGRRVVFQVRAHKWRCQQSSCQRRIFVERLNGLAAPWARMTQRLMRAVAQLGLATNGMGGADVARRLGMPTSASTVLRRLLRLPDPPPVRATRVGVDEWAYRRGKRYGSILVDLERRQVIDLLPDRKATTVADWFAQRPEITLVTRDRSREFAHAVAQGAPQATHVLDRWHLLKSATRWQLNRHMRSGGCRTLSWAG